jgi:PAS domain S-box-containing protein
MGKPSAASVPFQDPIVADTAAIGADLLRALAGSFRRRARTAPLGEASDNEGRRLTETLEFAAKLLDAGGLDDGGVPWKDPAALGLANPEGPSHPLAGGAHEHLGFPEVTSESTEPRGAEETLPQGDEMFRLLVESVRDYAIFMLDVEGNITSWNTGAQHLKGYRADEIVGQHFSRFYTEEDRRKGHPQYELERAIADGRYCEEGWRIRKDGSRFWASVVITAVRDPSGRHLGFAKVTRDMTERKNAEEALRRMNSELETRVRQQTAAQQEVEAFSYSVSHDLRAPLRALDGFSKLLLGKLSGRLDAQEVDYLQRIRGAAQQMSQLIDAMLGLSRLTRTPLHRKVVDLSAMCREIAASLAQAEPERAVRFSIPDGMTVFADERLLRIALENLLRNAWKFTRKTADAHIEIRVTERDGELVHYVKDNGVGLDMAQAHRLFVPFQRLHRARDFEGTGIGLVTVNRILQCHNGRIWVEAAPGHGATFYFVLEAPHGTGQDHSARRR